MFTIHLNKLAFYAHHGMHDEETVTGTGFEIDLSVEFEAAGEITSLHQTVNYVTIYTVIKKHMAERVALLETLAQNIVEDIHLIDDRIKLINIRINKLHPPIRNFVGSVGVSYSKAF